MAVKPQKDMFVSWTTDNGAQAYGKITEIEEGLTQITLPTNQVVSVNDCEHLEEITKEDYTAAVKALVEQLNENIGESNMDNQELVDQVAELTSAKEKLHEDFKASALEIEELKSQLEAIKEEKEALLTEKETAEKTVEETQAKVDELQAKFDEIEAAKVLADRMTQLKDIDAVDIVADTEEAAEAKVAEMTDEAFESTLTVIKASIQKLTDQTKTGETKTTDVTQTTETKLTEETISEVLDKEIDEQEIDEAAAALATDEQNDNQANDAIAKWLEK